VGGAGHESEGHRTVSNQTVYKLFACSRLQGQAESYLEKLHKLVEQDMNDLLDGTTAADTWPHFRETLIGLTDVTQSHFAKLVNELERGMGSLLETYRTGALPINL